MAWPFPVSATEAERGTRRVSTITRHLEHAGRWGRRRTRRGLRIRWQRETWTEGLRGRRRGVHGGDRRHPDRNRAHAVDEGLLFGPVENHPDARRPRQARARRRRWR